MREGKEGEGESSGNVMIICSAVSERRYVGHQVNRCTCTCTYVHQYIILFCRTYTVYII